MSLKRNIRTLTGRPNWRRPTGPKVHLAVEEAPSLWRSHCGSVLGRLTADMGTVHDVTCKRCIEALPSPPYEPRKKEDHDPDTEWTTARDL